MSLLDADPTPETTPPVLPDPIGTANEAQPARRPATVRLWAVTLAAGLAAGFGSWFLGESIYGRFLPELDTANSFMAPEVTAANAVKLRRATILEASLTCATLGAVLGLALGLAGGLARGSTRAGVTAAAFGLVLGAVGGFAGARLITPMQLRYTTGVGNDLVVALLTKGGISAIVGALAGAAFGLGLGDGGRRVDFRFIAGGLFGGFVGLVVYQMAGAIAFPLAGTTIPVSDQWPTRLFAMGAVAVCATFGVLLAQAPRAKAA